MVSRSELEAALASAHDPPERTLCLAAHLTRALTGPQPVVLVGGSAIEVYSAGLYVSADVDIVGDRTAAAKILESWGFAREGRIWWQPEWKVTIDLVGGPYTWSFERTRLMQTPYGPVRLAAVEDLLIKRLVEAKHWKNREALAQAILLYTAFAEPIDEGYLDQTARRELVADILRDLRASSPRRPKL